MKHLYILLLVVVVAVVTAESANAQGTDNAAVILNKKLRPGDGVTLSLPDRVVSGKLLNLTPDALVVQTGTGNTIVPIETVFEARRKRNGIFLGTIIGAGAGALPAGFFYALSQYEGTDGTPALMFIPLGAGIGAGIDALLARNRSVYRLNLQRRVSIAPAISSKTASVRTSIAW